MRIFGTVVSPCRVLMLSTLLCVANISWAAPNDKAEPPAEYTLLVNGKKIQLKLGEEVPSKVAGQQLRFKLSRQPFREFEKSGVKFQYPANYSFEADDSNPAAVSWTMSGSSSMVMLQRFAKVPAAQLSSDIISELTKQFGAKNVTTTPMTFFIRGRKLLGKRLNVSVAGQKFAQDVYAFSTVKNSFVFIIQDTPENGKPSAENIRLKVLLTQSLKW